MNVLNTLVHRSEVNSYTQARIVSTDALVLVGYRAFADSKTYILPSVYSYKGIHQPDGDHWFMACRRRDDGLAHSLHISPKFALKGPVNNNPAKIQTIIRFSLVPFCDAYMRHLTSMH